MAAGHTNESVAVDHTAGQQGHQAASCTSSVQNWPGKAKEESVLLQGHRHQFMVELKWRDRTVAEVAAGCNAGADTLPF